MADNSHSVVVMCPRTNAFVPVFYFEGVDMGECSCGDKLTPYGIHPDID